MNEETGEPGELPEPGPDGKYHIYATQAGRKYELADFRYDDAETAAEIMELCDEIYEADLAGVADTGRLLRAILARSGVSRRRLAFATGVYAESVERWVCGVRSINILTLTEAALVARRVEKLFAGTGRDGRRPLAVPAGLRLNSEPAALTADTERVILNPENHPPAAKRAALAELVRRSGLTQPDFALLIGYHKTTLNMMLAGKRGIKPEVLTRAAGMSEKAVRALRPLRTFPGYEEHPSRKPRRKGRSAASA